MEKDDRTWVVYELSSAGEFLASKGELLKKLRTKVPSEVEIFIPYSRIEYKGKTTQVHVMEGYCFVESGKEHSFYFKLGREFYFSSVLHVRGTSGAVLQTVPDKSIVELRKDLQKLISADLKQDMVVIVREGIYKGLTGKIVGFIESKDSALVYIDLRTLKTILTVPVYLLDIGDNHG